MTPGASAYPHLLRPLDLGHLTLRNRVVMGSMHTKLEDRARDIDKLAAYLGARAEGGVGLMVTGGYAPSWRGWLLPFGSSMVRAAQARRAGGPRTAKSERCRRQLRPRDKQSGQRAHGGQLINGRQTWGKLKGLLSCDIFLVKTVKLEYFYNTGYCSLKIRLV